MSTRSNTRIKNGDNITILYKHHDGYPEGVGAYLTDLLKKYGFDLFKRDDYLNVLNFEDYIFAGFEKTNHYSGDSAYIYTIDLDEKTLSYIDKRDYDDFEFDFDNIDNMESEILYDEYDESSIIEEIKNLKEEYNQKLVKLEDKLNKIKEMKAEELIDSYDYEIVEFGRHHWKFIDKEDHIDVYELREGDVIGGFYPPEASFTIRDIIDKVENMNEEELYNFIDTYIEYY